MEWYTILLIYCAICWLAAIIFFSMSVKDDSKIHKIDIIAVISAPIALPIFIAYVIVDTIFNL